MKCFSREVNGRFIMAMVTERGIVEMFISDHFLTGNYLLESDLAYVVPTFGMARQFMMDWDGKQTPPYQPMKVRREIIKDSESQRLPT